MTQDEAARAANAVSAANRLTARWAAVWDGGGTVLSGVGVWPLLATLVGAADGAARDELAEAIGLPAHDGLGAAHDLLGTLGDSAAVRYALGLWTAASLPLDADWVCGLPDGVHGLLDADPKQSQAALDAWVEEQTEGLLRRLPVRITASTLLVLASALTVRTRWDERFTSVPATPADGPWAGRRLSALRRRIAVSDICVAGSDDGPVSLVTVRGADGIDVSLALGEPGVQAGSTLATAVRSVRARREPVDLERDRPGPGLAVTEIEARSPEPAANLNTIAFTVNAHHDLLARADLFGLRTAADGRVGRFPGVSGVPLYVQAAAQDATATFSAEGFVAAAVTAVTMARALAMPRPPGQRAKLLTASFDRPFGFVAAHRPSGLVLACGWVADPDAYPL